MSRRAAARLAWYVWAAAVAGVAAGVFLYATSTRHLPGGSPYLLNLSVSALGFSTVGALVASRRPGNLVGWLFGATGLLYGLLAFAGEYFVYALFVAPEPPPAGLFTLWLVSWLWIPAGQMSLAIFLFFPDGRLPSSRWRTVFGLILAGVVINSASFAFRPGSLVEVDPRGLPPVENPFALESARLLGAIEAASVPLVGLTLDPVVALFVRYRRAREAERQQIKWVAYAAAMLTVAAAVVSVFPSLDGSALGGALFLVGYLAVPAAVGVAILRHRLYDIDRLINRTLVYGALSLVLALVYLVGMVSLQRLLSPLAGESNQLAVVASTLAIAALFSPLRQRLQSVTDRRFYRSKYDAAKTLEGFGARLRQETDLEDLRSEVLAVVQDTVQPEKASLWLRGPAGNASRNGPEMGER